MENNKYIRFDKIKPREVYSAKQAYKYLKEVGETPYGYDLEKSYISIILRDWQELSRGKEYVTRQLYELCKLDVEPFYGDNWGFLANTLRFLFGYLIEKNRDRLINLLIIGLEHIKDKEQKQVIKLFVAFLLCDGINKIYN